LPQLTLQLLGGFRLQEASGGEVKVTSRKARALLAYLAARPGDNFGRDRLAALLWEDADEELARTSLRQALATLRKCLPAPTQSALLADTDSIRLDTALLDSDVAAFRRCVAAGTRTALQEANSLYRGDLLEGFDARSGGFDEWLSAERLTLRKQAVAALQRLTTLCCASDDTDGALSAGTRLVALEPLNEAAQRTLMELHARRNAYGEALRQYRLCRDALRRELDVAPEPATEALYRELMRRRRATSVASDDGIATDEPVVATTDTSRRELRPQLRDAVILVVRLEGLLELEAVLDPEEAYALSIEFQNRVQRAIQEFGGCNDRRVGSSVLAAFGLPNSHGNEAERAVRAALLLRDHIAKEAWPVRQKLNLRCGIAQGQVLCNAELFPVTGRPAQVAHALAARATEGQILVSEELHRALGERIVTQPAPRSQAAEPASAWLLQSIRTDSGNSLQPFVGRRPELALILAVMDRCASSRHGRAIVIRGEAGIGKTRLSNAVRAAAQDRGVATHCAQVFDFGQSPGRRPITSLALSLLGVDADAPAQTRRDAVRRCTQGSSGVDQLIYLSDLADAPLDAELQALERAMETATRQRGRSLALAQLIESAAQRKPLLIIVEDVHWADADELARLGEIAATATNCPVLLLMTTRPQEDPLNASWRARARGCPVTTVDLAPLAADEAHELAAHYADLPRETIESCVRRAEGYPLFLDQLLRAASAGHEALPGSVRGLVLARADRLSAENRHALQAGAVLGHRFGITALRQVTGDADFDPALLVEAALIRSDGMEIEFAHALFRDAIYESTLKSQRRELHHRAAEWFVAKDAALHADHLAAAEDESAPRAYLDAARAEQAALRFERALALVNKAMALAREPAMLHRTGCLLGEVLLQLGRTHDALAAYRESLDFAQDHASQSQGWFGIASALRIMDRHEEALDALDRAEAALDDSTDARTRARMYTLRGNLCFPLGRIDDCLRAHEQAQHFAKLAGSPIDIARALGGLGDAYYQRGRMLTSQKLFAECVEEARKHALAGVLLANLPMLGITQTYCGAPRLAVATYREAIELARRIGDLRSEMLTCICMTTTQLVGGEVNAAEHQAQRALELARQLGARRFQAETLNIIANTLLLRGNRKEALRLAEESVVLGRETGMSYCGPVLLSIVARATENPAQRRDSLDEGAALLAAGCVSHSYFEFYGNAIEVSLQQGQWQDAREYANKLQDYTRAERLPWMDILIERARALADIGEGLANDATRESLARLRSECVRMNTLAVLPSIEAALRRLRS
jgi:DNA-binding SARP family transcriptional activator/tetratricopeptide (TPR) repeat protein